MTSLQVAEPPDEVTPPRARLAGSRPWIAFLARRLVRFLVSMFLLVTASFAMVHALPGDPVRDALGVKAAPEVVASTRQRLGLDHSLWQQYVDYLHGLFTFDLGTSLSSGTPVREIMTQLVPPTLALGGTAFLATICVSIPVGMAVGVASRDGRRRGLHLSFAGVTGLLLSIPDYVLSVGLVFVLAVTLRAFPVAGQGGPASYVLPVTALAAGPVAYLARIVRAETQRVLAEEYMRTARSKRLPARLLYVRHAFPNILTATLTVSGLVLSSLIAGTVLVESVFAWPGIGHELVQSVLATDFPVVQAVALFFGSAVLLINLAVDVVIAIVDPRSTIRES
ncbi:ABC transporter permease [Actinomadura sp. DC4]|uniref:ABC transporter permease n=1 Tax=Actinomadura sp. DC4 TaxID=3055069 RepID=UPI0025B06F2C|nr:ABC transporter permease [Actinomadura sp. DC4]MDN3353640.1 ABC transporter permease [Actinomadura sp. DC4]